MTVRIIHGDCRDVLRTLPDESVHCVVTSPPYWGLRDYGVAGQLGLETSLGEHIENMVGVFREVWRVLRKDGTLWLNYGDSYATAPNGRKAADIVNDDRTFRDKPFSTIGPISRVGQSGNKGNGGADHGFRIAADGYLKPKDLCGIPWRVAFALQADGWYLRSDIIWSKPNPMPESVTDRPTKAHEYLFLMSKSERYFYDGDAIREPYNEASLSRYEYKFQGSTSPGRHQPNNKDERYKQQRDGDINPLGRNKRTVWEIPTSPFPEAHFATFPPALIEPCIKAGTSEKGCCAKCGAPWVREVETDRDLKLIEHCRKQALEIAERARSKAQDTPRNDGSAWNENDGRGFIPLERKTIGWLPSCQCAVYDADGEPFGLNACTVLDPFGGAGTTGLVADRLGRNAILIELNPEYAQMAERRITGDCPMFAEVSA